MIKKSLDIISDQIKCSSCEKEGHKLESVLVETKNGYRNLKFCICCGNKSVCRNLNSHSVRKNEHDPSSNACLVTNII